MSVIVVTRDSFESIVSLPGVVFVDCWAPWCPPCRAFKPVFEAASESHPDITFCSIDTQQESALAEELGITSIPTILAFRDGILVFGQAGALSAPDFNKLIDAVQGLNMDEVRAEIAARSAD